MASYFCGQKLTQITFVMLYWPISCTFQASEQARNKATVVTTKPGLHDHNKTNQDDDKQDGEGSGDVAIGTDSTTSQSEVMEIL